MTNGAMIPHAQRVKTVREMFERSRAQIAMALPRHMTTDRMLRVALTEIQKTPLLLECEPLTLVAAVIQAAQLGLELGVLGQAYLVPFKNTKKQRMEVQLIPGYRGLVQLARRSGQIVTFEARVVHEKDEFYVSYGLEGKLVHKPNMTEEKPGAVVAAYAFARFKDGGFQYECMSVRELNAIRSRSKASDSGPWVTDTEEMYRKTVAKRLCKWLPASVELANAVDLDNKAEVGLGQDIEIIGEGGEIIDTPQIPEKTGLDAAAADLAKAPEKPAPAVAPTASARPAPAPAAQEAAPPAEDERDSNSCDHADVKNTRLYKSGKRLVCPVCEEEVQGPAPAPVGDMKPAVDATLDPVEGVKAVAKAAGAIPPRRGQRDLSE